MEGDGDEGELVGCKKADINNRFALVVSSSTRTGQEFNLG